MTTNNEAVRYAITYVVDSRYPAISREVGNAKMWVVELRGNGNYFSTFEEAVAYAIKRDRERIYGLERLCLDLWHELNYQSIRDEDGNNRCLEAAAEFDDRMKRQGLLEGEQ